MASTAAIVGSPPHSTVTLSLQPALENSIATTGNSNVGSRIIFCISEYPQNESFILVNYFTERCHIQVRSRLRYGINPYTKLLANQTVLLH